MLTTTIAISLSWGILAGITHIFLSTLQKTPQASARYFFRLIFRYSILLGFVVTLVNILHGNIGFFGAGFSISTVAFLIHTIKG